MYIMKFHIEKITLFFRSNYNNVIDANIVSHIHSDNMDY